MVLSRVHPKVSKDQVVFTALFLIFLALILARILPSLVPQQGPVLEFVVGGFFLFFSYNMVNILVGGAIDKAINEGIQKHQQENSFDEIVENQNLEFYALIPSAGRMGIPSLTKFYSNQELDKIGKEALVRDAILKGLGADDKLLQLIALRACQKVLHKEKATDDEINSDDDLKVFCLDIYIYLKAWLMLSIKYRREMPVENIKQSYPSEKSPDRWAYIQAITEVKDKFIDRPNVIKSIDTEEYREPASEIIKKYLSYLIDELRTSNQNGSGNLK